MLRSGHHSDCQKLLTLLNVALPDTFSKCIEHRESSKPGTENECLMHILSIVVRKSLRNPDQITSYAVLCSEMAEAFGSDPSYNPFKVALARQLKTEFEETRRMVDSMQCRNQEEYDAVNAEINQEKDKARLNLLVIEQKARKRSRDELRGLMKLFGELFNFGLLAYGVVRLCIIKLLVPIAGAVEIDVECFCILMKTVGAVLESTQEGIEIADKYMTGLEVLINQGRADKFCERVRNMIRELFYLRADQWNEVEVTKSAPQKIFQNNELIETANLNKSFLTDLGAAVSNVKTQKDWLDFIHFFCELKIWNEDILMGLAHILARHAMSNPKQLSMLALVCRGLGDLSAPSPANSQKPKTFVAFLKYFCDQEKILFQTNATNFKSFKSRVQALKLCTDEIKFRQQKHELTSELKTHERSKNFVNFFGELFNAEVIQSQEVLDFFHALMAPDTISDVSIECICSTFAIVASKMLTEPNHNLLMKDIVVKLSKATNTGDFSIKSRQLVNELEKTAYFRFELHTDFEPAVNFMPQFTKSFSTTFSTDSLWTSPMRPKSFDLGHEPTQKDFFKKYLPCTRLPPGFHGLDSVNNN